MSFATTALLGAAAGFSIFIGLPIARLKAITKSVQGFLNAVATGILIYLLFDILRRGTEPLAAAMGTRSHAGRPVEFGWLIALFLLGIGVGLIGLVLFNRAIFSRARAAGETGAPRHIALAIATGLGLHNLSEGLAIGQSAASGALSLAGVLILGFALHNITEGFGIAAPLAGASQPPSWTFLLAAGAIGGAPTLLGTMIGYAITSVFFSVLFLALAAGALIWVLNELFAVGRRLNSPPAFGWGLLTGFVAGFSTDMLLTFLGA